MFPLSIVYNLSSKLNIVVFPAPDLPTKATVSLGLISKDKSLIIFSSSL